MKKAWMIILLAVTVIMTTGAGARADTPGRAGEEPGELNEDAEVDPNYVPPEIFTSGDYQYWISEDKESVIIAGYTGDEEEIEIPSELDGYPVSEIGYEAFGYQKMKSLSVPDSICCIEHRAFEYCVITDELQLPENVSIGIDAFSYAEMPRVVTVPAGAAAEKGAFSYCEKMELVLIGPDAVIKSRAFGYCDDLDQVVCGEGSRLEEKAFEYCEKLEKAVLCGETETDEDAFHLCGDAEVTEAEAGEYDAWKQSGFLKEDP